MSLGLKVKEFLYNKGMKGFGAEILRSKYRGSPEWLAFGLSLLKEGDFPTRSLFLKQATTKGFFQKTKKRRQVIDVLCDYMKRGLSDEKRLILKFLDSNASLFSKDDEKLLAAIFTLQRDPDTVVSNAAEQVLKKLGFEHDHHKPVR